jgi:hypothetical protein
MCYRNVGAFCAQSSDAQWFHRIHWGPWLASQPLKQRMQQQPTTSLAPFPGKEGCNLRLMAACDSFLRIISNYIDYIWLYSSFGVKCIDSVWQADCWKHSFEINRQTTAAQHQAINQTEKKKILRLNNWPLIATASSWPLRLATRHVEQHLPL